MKYFILDPQHKNRLKSLINGAPDLGVAMKKYISAWPIFLLCGFDRNLGIRGKKRIRKKKMQKLLKQVFVEEFLSCMIEKDLSPEEGKLIHNNLGVL